MADERVDPGTFAYQLLAHLADVHGDAGADLYASGVVAELFELCPVIREYVSDLILADLKEEVARREDPRYSRATVALVEEIETDWRNGSR